MTPVELLQRMVECPSLSGEEGELARLLVGAMRDMGFQAEVDEVGNAVGTREVPLDGTVSREIVLLGHMDTVPGAIPVRLETGSDATRLYGRGAVDAKGPLAAFVAAAAQATLPPGTRVVVIGAVEEESATSRGARHVAERYRPDACLIGEPSGWDALTLGYKGRLLVDYALEQPMSHSAGSNEAVAERAVAWWLHLRRLADEWNSGRERLFDQLLPSLRHIHTTSDGLHDRVEMRVGVRLPPQFDAERFQEQLCGAADGATLRFHAHEPAFQAPRASWLAGAVQRAIRAQGVRPRLKLKTGTSDMNVVGPRWQCPILAYGPGDSALDHTPEEHLVIEEFLRAIEVVRAVLEASPP